MNSVAYELDPGEDRPTVLVVEDEVLIRLMIAEELRRQGVNVVEASDAEEALAVLQGAVPVQLLLTDLQMPGSFDGTALASMVHASFPTIKIVVASSLPPGKSLRAIAHAAFLKPYDLTAVVRQVKELLPESQHHASQA
jgi:CheY-like chemotaxis protein